MAADSRVAQAGDDASKPTIAVVTLGGTIAMTGPEGRVVVQTLSPEPWVTAVEA
jgi:L-asparaginase/Glu-tRNA(Gln) amidotransferase subunit D